MTDRIDRRQFIKQVAGLGITVAGGGIAAESLLQQVEAAPAPTIVVASNAAPGILTRRAVDALGGMKRFVKSGNKVVIKPNIGWARKPEEAANTHPDVVTEVIKMCYEAGAKEVVVFDHPCDTPRISYEMSGIKEAAERARARVIVNISDSAYQTIQVPKGKILKTEDVRVIRDILKSDVFINLPIAKTHGSAQYTVALKNMMGAILDRGAWHGSADLNQCIADFATAVKAHLTIVDANRILLTNGPKGPGKTKDTRQVIAGIDPVALDSYSVTLFGTSGEKVSHIMNAYKLGVGEIDLKKVNIKRV